jgi:hypothetical protein
MTVAALVLQTRPSELLSALRDGDTTCRAEVSPRRPDGAQLEQVVSSSQAKAVRKRLLSVRPSGGRFYVDAAGVTVTCLGGAWVFAGRVGPREWFSGDVVP